MLKRLIDGGVEKSKERKWEQIHVDLTESPTKNCSFAFISASCCRPHSRQCLLENLKLE